MNRYWKTIIAVMSVRLNKKTKRTLSKTELVAVVLLKICRSQHVSLNLKLNYIDRCWKIYNEQIYTLKRNSWDGFKQIKQIKTHPLKTLQLISLLLVHALLICFVNIGYYT